MGDLARIVFCQAGAKIGSEADIALIGVRETVEDVGIVHDLFLYFLATRSSVIAELRMVEVRGVEPLSETASARCLHV